MAGTAVSPALPWRFDDRGGGGKRLVVRYDNLGGDGANSWLEWVAMILAGLVVLAGLLPLLDHWLGKAFVVLMVVTGALVWIAHRARIVDTVVDFANGLVYHRRRRVYFSLPRREPLAQYTAVLSHLGGENGGISVCLSGVAGEFEIARFGPAVEQKNEYWSLDHPQAIALRRLLAERLNLRLLGVL